MSGQADAQRLVRLMLADPLGALESWEREIEGEGDGRAVLVK